MTHGARDNQLVVPLSVEERELLNELAAEVGVPVAELARRLLLRYLAPPDRDDVDERIGQTLLARAGALGHIPADASAKVRQAIRDLGLNREEPV
jgi:hypothetical protein